MSRVAIPLAAVTALAVTLAGCGSGDSTVAKTPSAPSSTAVAAAPPESVETGAAAPPGAPADPCAVNLAAPAIAKAVSELPHDPRSGQPWNPEPVAGNYSECTDLSAVIVKANTNTEHRNTRAVLFHRGQYLPQTAPDTYGFSGIDLAHCTPDTVALQTTSGIAGLTSTVRFHWNGSAVAIVANTPTG
ncbi:LppP/LprE family lipoprotein [Mycobacterium sp. M1]|uniref:LppP/LprE family lipoprotein n=1 Tax=Mycolicibacter acidiphilus TaxID=2835306 RepID=A0ABS5RLG0_9MYCO|nr:LppP/LprE family lipoprotein [Mycolicibacter acidiphilus]MBS9535135.1 LppP/LprE family lipoprotein [Mycolicibacter acidiphilus]